MKYTALVLLLLLAGCGSSNTRSSSGSTSGPGSIPDPSLPPVMAQATYSTASIIGTYSVNLVVVYNGFVSTDIGSITFDGKGNITDGVLTVYGASSPCTVTLGGGYTLHSNADGIASITLSPSTGSCTPNPILQFVVQAAQSGESLMFAESDGLQVVSGNAVKQ